MGTLVLMAFRNAAEAALASALGSVTMLVISQGPFLHRNPTTTFWSLLCIMWVRENRLMHSIVVIAGYLDNVGWILLWQPVEGVECGGHV